jgi:hypothetical protein
MGAGCPRVAAFQPEMHASDVNDCLLWVQQHTHMWIWYCQLSVATTCRVAWSRCAPRWAPSGLWQLSATKAHPHSGNQWTLTVPLDVSTAPATGLLLVATAAAAACRALSSCAWRPGQYVGAHSCKRHRQQKTYALDGRALAYNTMKQCIMCMRPQLHITPSKWLHMKAAHTGYTHSRCAT